MGLLYLDSTNGWSDPAKTSYTYYRADGVWAKADSTHRFLDATLNYSVPELISLATPSGVQAAAKAAQTDPTGIYNTLKDQLTPAISFGSTYGSVQFRLIGTKHDDLYYGSGKAGLSFIATGPLAKQSAMAPNGTNAGGYRQSATTMQSTLSSALSSMESKWKSIVSAVKKECSTGVTTKETVTFYGLWIPSWAELGFVSNPTGATPNEGTTYEYFKDVIDISSDKRNLGAGRYWCRTGYYKNNNRKYFGQCGGTDWIAVDADVAYNVVVGFCVE